MKWTSLVAVVAAATALTHCKTPESASSAVKDQEPGAEGEPAAVAPLSCPVKLEKTGAVDTFTLDDAKLPRVITWTSAAGQTQNLTLVTAAANIQNYTHEVVAADGAKLRLVVFPTFTGPWALNVDAASKIPFAPYKAFAHYDRLCAGGQPLALRLPPQANGNVKAAGPLTCVVRIDHNSQKTATFTLSEASIPAVQWAEAGAEPVNMTLENAQAASDSFGYRVVRSKTRFDLKLVVTLSGDLALEATRLTLLGAKEYSIEPGSCRF